MFKQGQCSSNNRNMVAGFAVLFFLMALGTIFFSDNTINSGKVTPTEYYNSPRIDTTKKVARWNWEENRPIYQEEYDSIQKARGIHTVKKAVESTPQYTEEDMLEDMVEDAVDKYMD